MLDVFTNKDTKEPAEEIKNSGYVTHEVEAVVNLAGVFDFFLVEPVNWRVKRSCVSSIFGKSVTKSNLQVLSSYLSKIIILLIIVKDKTVLCLNLVYLVKVVSLVKIISVKKLVIHLPQSFVNRLLWHLLPIDRLNDRPLLNLKIFNIVFYSRFIRTFRFV